MIDFDEIFEKKFDRRILWIVIIAFLVAIYIFNLMFGNKSLSRLIDLQNSVKVMQKKVKRLKMENTKLQKSYFELKELEGG